MGEYALAGLVRRFICDQSGTTALEYGLMLAIFSIVVTTALATVGTNLSAMFTKMNGYLQ